MTDARPARSGIYLFYKFSRQYSTLNAPGPRPAGPCRHTGLCPMSLPGHRLPSRWLLRPMLLATAAFLMLLAATGALGIRYWHERQAASQGAEHSRQVIETLDQVQVHLTDLQA